MGGLPPGPWWGFLLLPQLARATPRGPAVRPQGLSGRSVLPSGAAVTPGQTRPAPVALRRELKPGRGVPVAALGGTHLQQHARLGCRPAEHTPRTTVCRELRMARRPRGDYRKQNSPFSRSGRGGVPFPHGCDAALGLEFCAEENSSLLPDRGPVRRAGSPGLAGDGAWGPNGASARAGTGASGVVQLPAVGAVSPEPLGSKQPCEQSLLSTILSRMLLCDLSRSAASRGTVL